MSVGQPVRVDPERLYAAKSRWRNDIRRPQLLHSVPSLMSFGR